MSYSITGIVVARSRKFNGYCVVVFDILRKTYYRLTSDNSERHDHELSHEECCYKNGSLIELRDLVEVKVKSFERVKDKVQTENLIIDPTFTFNFKEKYNFNTMINHLENNLCKDYHIFSNQLDSLTPLQAQSLRKSFTIASVTNLRFYKSLTSNGVDHRCVCSFDYNGIRYNNMRVTISESKEEDIRKYAERFYRKATIGISYGHVYEKTNLHYKFVCSFLGGY